MSRTFAWAFALLLALRLEAQCPTAAPQSVAPRDGAQDVSSPVDFVWTPVKGATKYAVLLRLNDGALAPIGETTDVHLQIALDAGNYEWRVAALFDGCPATLSDLHRFSITTACDNRRPLLLTPADGARDLVSTVQFTWTRVRGAKQYRVWLADRNAATLLGTISDNALKSNVSPGANHWFVEATFDGCPATRSAIGDFFVLDAKPPCGTPAKPLANAIGQTLSGSPYSVRWTPVANADAYELQEATVADFSRATSQTVNGIGAAFTHAANGNAAQPYFYRVRALSNCNDARGAFSTPVRVIVVPQRPTAKEHHASVEVGTDQDVVQTVFLSGNPGAVGFSARVDKPWLKVTPSTGELPPDGATLTVTADPALLPPGTNSGTLKITYLAPQAAGKVRADAVTPKDVPVSVTLVSPVTPGGQDTPPADALIIPAVAHAAGANDSLFESDVRVTNLSPQTMKYQLHFTPSGVDGTQNGSVMTVQVEPGGTMALDDVLANFFGIGADGASATGMLEIRPLSSTSTSTSTTLGVTRTTVASSRTYNSTPTGTFGQFIPAIPFAQFVGKGEGVLSLQQIAQSTLFRTNFGIAEASGAPAEVLLRVFNAAGQSLKEIPISLLAAEHLPLNSLLAANGIALDDGRVEVEVRSGTGRVTAYASEIDNQTNDPLLVPGAKKESAGATRYVLPGMADINNGLASWRSDLRVFNPASAATPATLTYYPQGAPGSPLLANITVNGGEVRAIDNALESLFGLTNSGGAIVVTTPSPSQLIVTARTYNQTATGTYGQFIPAVTPAQSIALGADALQILQVEQSERIRTNIGIDETSGNAATVEIALVLPDSKVTMKTAIALAPNEFRQISVADFGAGTLYNGRVTVKVIAGIGKVTAYGSAIDQATQDPTYVAAQ